MEQIKIWSEMNKFACFDPSCTIILTVSRMCIYVLSSFVVQMVHKFISWHFSCEYHLISIKTICITHHDYPNNNIVAQTSTFFWVPVGPSSETGSQTDVGGPRVLENYKIQKINILQDASNADIRCYVRCIFHV